MCCLVGGIRVVGGFPVVGRVTMGFLVGGLIGLRTGLTDPTVGEGAQAQMTIKMESCEQFSNGISPF